MTEEKKRQGKAPAGKTRPGRGSTVVKKHPEQDGTSLKHKKQAPKHAKKADDWDDLFLEDTPKKKKKPAPHSRSARRAKAKRRARMKRTAWGSLSALFACVCLLIVGFCTLSTMRYFEFLEMRAYLDRDTFYPGVTVDGTDLSGYTLTDAMDSFRSREMDYAASQGLSFTLDGKEYEYSAVELGFGSNYAAILQAAWDVGRDGSISERYAEATAGRAFTVDRGYDETILRQATYALAASLTCDSVDAQVTDFIFNKGQFVFSEEEPGSFVDSEELYQQAASALASGTQTVAINRTVVEPETTVEELSASYGEIAVAVTNASSSNDNRINNIRLACSAINCILLEPGQEFSFNDTVGQRTKSAGYKKAGVYISGEVGEEIGGGICQVSTTLFNAVVKADLEITERHNHSLPVSYVDNGKDATDRKSVV